ncbi:MAG: diacylglycerol kinase family protein [Acidimicrobiia bacterium]
MLIVNPFASSVTARGRVIINKALRAGHEVTTAETSRRGHATRFAQDAAARGFDVVAVLGGDGTLNEAANGLVGTSCALAPLPGGSTNVFARTLGYPNDPVEATDVLVDALDAGSMRRVGLGSVNGRYFLFHTGIGFDAAVVREVERRGSLKRWAGHPLFVYAGLATWARRRRNGPAPFSISHSDGTVVPQAEFAICMNTNPYTFLGNRPLELSTAATLDRGLVMVGFRDLKASTILPALGSALRGRGVPDSKRVSVRTDLDQVIVEAVEPIPYQVDGDDLGDASRLVFKHEPDVMNLVLPSR